jgi:hypothetical protein
MEIMKKVFTEKLGKFLLLTGTLLLLFAIAIFFWNDFNFSIKDKIQADKVGQFGDFVGGLIGSIWALAGVVLFYVALTEQRKDFKTNRKVLNTQIEALKLQLNEFELQRLELSETREIFKIQKFETSFFNLLKFHSEITNSLTIKVEKRKSSSGGKEEKEVAIFDGIKFFVKGNVLIENFLYELKNLDILTGQILDDSKANYIKNKKIIDNEAAKYIQNTLYEKGPLVDQKIAFLLFYYSFEPTLDKYMGQLLMLVVYIDKTRKDINAFPTEIYIALLKAQLSKLELKFIWIYCHSFKRPELELLMSYDIIPKRISLFMPQKY